MNNLRFLQISEGVQVLQGSCIYRTPIVPLYPRVYMGTYYIVGDPDSMLGSDM